MRRPTPGANVAVFALFFLLALIEALGSRNWVLVALYVGLGLLSIYADSSRRSRQH